jgi:quercetin 2,3-dioxygenase
MSLMNCIRTVSALGTPPYATLDPFLFAVYHKDNYPAGNGKMEAPRMGDGADFDPNASYRMYHGERVPGFPSHPHRGFETLTATIDGLIDHADSTGSAGRYGFGDNQWMTAGKGIQHSEMFPLLNTTAPNPTRFFQIWLNLPSASKMVDTAFVMHWGEDIPKVVSDDGLSSATIFAGEIGSSKGLPPPPNSWAADENNEVSVFHITLKPGAVFELPEAKGGQDINRQVYWIEGQSLTIGDRKMSSHSIVNLNAGVIANLKNDGTDTSEVLVLQGKPINEPVAQHGPFVMNTQSEIQQAFSDYQKTQFGGKYIFLISNLFSSCIFYFMKIGVSIGRGNNGETALRSVSFLITVYLSSCSL